MLAVSRLSTEGKGVFKVKVSSCLWLKSQAYGMPFPQVKFSWCVPSLPYSQHKGRHRSDKERLLALFLSPHKACSVSVRLRPALSTVDVNLFHLTPQTSQNLVR